MADDAPRHPGPFDVRTIEALVALMSQHGLNEVLLRDGDLRICLRRGYPAAAPVAYAAGPPVMAPQPVATPPGGGTATPPPAPPPRNLHEIKSPTVGTFYSQEKPGSPPFVTVGTRVSPSTVVCLIEAMKLFNEITADCSGVVTEVLVKNKEPVEYGTVLFRVDTSA